MLDAQDLAARRGPVRLFAGLGLALAAGEALVVTGANGRGKTTLLRILAGLSEPEAGTIRLDGRVVGPYAAALRRAVAFAGHAVALKDEFSVRENLASLATLAGADPDPEAIDDALARAGLGSRAGLPARLLSQGQRRRVHLARLALVPRRLWILDEPLTALDTEAAKLLAGMMARHLAAGGALVAATHAGLDLPPGRARTLALDAAEVAA
jgi:heme exporter protein A